MELDKIVTDAITDACQEELAPSSAKQISKLIERHISDKLQPSQLRSSLEAIYTIFKE